MGIVKLNERERLIERILRLPEDQVTVIAEFAEDLDDETFDVALIETRKKETGIPFDEYLSEIGITREELETIARSEGLIT
jgi:hypothetical protein